jgi:pimeloyl-ACP methyl ester carboxylesterase
VKPVPLHEDSLELPSLRQLSWCEYGAPDGQPVVHCHGLPGSRLEHPPHTRAAAERGLRFIVPDRPGYGGTSPRTDRVLGEETEDIRSLADHLGLNAFDVLGFSGGGPHALAVAARFPERVDRLGLVSSWAPFDRAGLDGMAEANRQLWELARRDFQAFAEALEGAIASAGSAYDLLVGGAPPEDQAIFQDEAVAAAYRANTDEAMRHGSAGMLEDAAAIIGPWAFELGAIRCPVRLWHGDRDANAPVAMGRWLESHLPRARLTEWPGTAHFGLFPNWETILDGLAGP